MESTGKPGRIQLSRSTNERVYDLFEFEEGEQQVKGKGTMKTYMLSAKHHLNPIDVVVKNNQEEEYELELSKLEKQEEEETAVPTKDDPSEDTPQEPTE